MEIKINRDIMSYEEKLLFGLTIRELFIIGAGALLSLIIYVLTEPAAGASLAGWLSVFNELIYVFLALLRINSRPLYAFLGRLLEYACNRKRVFNRKTNLFEED